MSLITIKNEYLEQIRKAKEIAVCYILHTSDLKIEESFVFLPVYMAGLL